MGGGVNPVGSGVGAGVGGTDFFLQAPKPPSASGSYS
jgi:hypothetical protein